MPNVWPKKGISGLKHFASKLSEVVPDEPVEPEEEPPAEDTAIPVSPHRKFRRGYMTPNPNRKSRRACFRP